MPKSLLIVTHRRGFEADPIIDKLRQRGVSLFRYNLDLDPPYSEVSIAFDDRKAKLAFQCDGRKITSDNIVAGWCQQLPPYFNKPHASGLSVKVNSQWTAESAAFELLEVPWFNPPINAIKSSNKVRQLNAAVAHGLLIPKTLISNLPNDVRNLIRGTSTVLKNLSTPWFEVSEKTLAAYTKTIDPKWLEDDEAITFCPAIYQPFIKRDKDWRVVVVGTKVFSAWCRTGIDQKDDIRRGNIDELNYYPDKFPEKESRHLLSLLKTLGLNYCSCDFIESDGNFYFIDLNVCGAWWWLDKQFEGAISAALVSSLYELYSENAERSII